MRPSDVSLALACALRDRAPVLLVGPPGVGKTELVTAAADATGADLIVMHPVVSDPTDYKGLPCASQDGQTAHFLPFGDLAHLVSADRPTVAFLDDLGQAPPAVQAAAMQLLLARRVNGHRVSDHVTFLAATNRRQDRAGITSILEPIKSRFTTILHVEPDPDDWIDWALAEGLPIEVIAFVRFRPAFVSQWEPTPDIVNGPCPRTIANAARIFAHWRELPAELLHETIAGAAGEGFATEFLAFLHVWRDLPDPDAILADPDAAPVPDSVAARYAVCGALTQRATEQTAARVIRYAERMPTEFNVLLVSDCARRDGFAQTRAYIQWCADHRDVLL